MPVLLAQRKSSAIFSYGFSYFPGKTDFRLQKLPSDVFIHICSIPLGYEPDSAALGQLYTVLSGLIPHMQPADLSTADHLVRIATDYMAQYPNLSITQIARLCDVSETTLYAAFRKVSGITPNDMRQKLVIENAVKLLMTTSNSVQQISDRLGFSSTNYFRLILKKHTGMTPREIRNGAPRL